MSPRDTGPTSCRCWPPLRSYPSWNYTALSSVQHLLPEGYSSVGAEIHLKHIRPVVSGTSLACHSRLTDVIGRKLFFEISLRAGTELVATASHITGGGE